MLQQNWVNDCYECNVIFIAERLYKHMERDIQHFNHLAEKLGWNTYFKLVRHTLQSVTINNALLTHAEQAQSPELRAGNELITIDIRPVKSQIRFLQNTGDEILGVSVKWNRDQLTCDLLNSDDGSDILSEADISHHILFPLFQPLLESQERR